MALARSVRAGAGADAGASTATGAFEDAAFDPPDEPVPSTAQPARATPATAMSRPVRFMVNDLSGWMTTCPPPHLCGRRRRGSLPDRPPRSIVVSRMTSLADGTPTRGHR